MANYLSEWREQVLSTEDDTSIPFGMKKLGWWQDIFLPTEGDMKIEIHRIEVGTKKDEK